MKVTSPGLKEYQAKWQKSWRKANREEHLIRALRASAKKKELEFNLEAKDIEIPSECPILGIPLFFSEKGRTDNTPSVDRINNDLGYVRGNIRVTSWRFNRLKSDASFEELIRIGRWANAILERRSV